MKIKNDIKFKIKFALICSASLFIFEFLVMIILRKFPAPSYFIETIINVSAVSIFTNVFIYNYLIKDLFKQDEELNLEFLRHKNSLDRTAIISETDTNGIITSVNDLLCKISGYSKDELIGQPHKILNSKCHSSEFWKEFWETITSGKEWKGEICNIAKDGSLYWVDATVIPNLDIEGKITGYTAVRIDITQRKESQRQMEHKAKLASIGEMAAGVGHEINNPLAISTGNISIIRKIIESDNIVSPRIVNAIKKIEFANERIRKIVDGLRTYARADSDHIEIVSISSMITQTIGLVDEIYRKDGIEIVIEIKNDEAFVYGNIGKLQQVLMNLISNARDATSGKEKRKILISLFIKDNTSVILSVTDNGTGIHPEIMDKIFNPFFTTKDVGLGTGIGLGVVSEFLKKMNAQIKVESKIGEGSSFIITFPLVDGTILEQQQLQQLQQQQQQQQQLSGNILIVDDEADIREILSDIVKEFGLEVDSAECADHALLKIEQKKYNYICSDIKMPGMDGDEFFKLAKNLPNGRDSKYLFMSAGVASGYDKEKRLNLWELGDGYIQKPFTKDSVYKILNNKK